VSIAVTSVEHSVAATDATRDYILLSHGIDRQLHYKLSKLVAENKRNAACTVFLTTYGGDPNGGYRVARCLRHHYEHVRLVVPSFCKSAGTLIAIAANELAIGDFGELGPLDIQIRKPSELQENSSGLDIMQALQTVTAHTQQTFHRMLVETRNASGLSTKLCAEFAGKVAAAIAAPLFAQIDPTRLGEMQRATRVAYEYGKRLDKYCSNLKRGALERLIGDYPAHGFVIDRKEATELFNRVSGLTPNEDAFCAECWTVLAGQADVDPCFIVPPDVGQARGAEDEESVPKRSDSEACEEGAGPKPDRGDIQEQSNSSGNSAQPDEQGLRIRQVDSPRSAARRRMRSA